MDRRMTELVKDWICNSDELECHPEAVNVEPRKRETPRQPTGEGSASFARLTEKSEEDWEDLVGLEVVAEEACSEEFVACNEGSFEKVKDENVLGLGGRGPRIRRSCDGAQQEGRLA